MIQMKLADSLVDLFGHRSLKGKKEAKEVSERVAEGPSIEMRRAARDLFGHPPAVDDKRCAHIKHGTGCFNTSQKKKNSCTLFPSLDEKIVKWAKLYLPLIAHCCFEGGLYALLLEPWYELFGSDLLVVSTDSLKGDNFTKTMSSIFSHLGLSPYEATHEVCTDAFKFCLLSFVLFYVMS